MQSGSTGRILVVDSDPDIRMFLEVTLSIAGFGPVETASGADDGFAIASRSDDPPDVVITELVLGDVGGLEFIDRLKRDPVARGAAIVVLSMKSRGMDQVRALSAGADDFVSKPFDPDVLVARIGARLRPTVEELTPREWDFFVSHASPDKPDFVRPLAVALRDAGLQVWYDEFQLELGKSLRASIDEGLARSRYGVVVLSPAFLEIRRWTELELNGLFAAEKRILPIFHGVSPQEVADYSPMLADKTGVLADEQSPVEVASELVRFFRQRQRRP